ncbi:hypothetical protein [Prevotella sp. HCN-7019]|uniref:hypothetical protein n=1 Tax=Prevotella sp. HCN-7019 TaxID=3134668 RepID=UPI0030BDBDF8
MIKRSYSDAEKYFQKWTEARRKSFDYDILTSIEDNNTINDIPGAVDGHICINSDKEIGHVSVSVISGIVYDIGKQTKSWKSRKLTSGISINGRLYSEKLFVE